MNFHTLVLSIIWWLLRYWNDPCLLSNRHYCGGSFFQFYWCCSFPTMSVCVWVKNGAEHLYVRAQKWCLVIKELLKAAFFWSRKSPQGKYEIFRFPDFEPGKGNWASLMRVGRFVINWGPSHVGCASTLPTLLHSTRPPCRRTIPQHFALLAFPTLMCGLSCYEQCYY